jgi:lysyl-tRNA synthetase class 1
VLFETGYGPSGLPHIGTFQEVLRTTLVRRAYEVLSGGAPTRLVAFSATTWTDCARCPTTSKTGGAGCQPRHKPLTRIPDPFGTHESFAHHNNAMLRAVP